MSLVNVEQIRLLISLLDEVAFASLCNSLLVETAVWRGIDRNCFRVTLNTKEPDGGVDASCVDARTVVPGLIPRPSTYFQYKSGRKPKSATKIIEDDVLAKPRVMEGLRRGFGFVYMAGWDRSDSIEEALANVLRGAGIAVEDGQIAFVGSEMLAQRLAAVPALILRHFQLQLNKVFAFEHWSRWRNMSNQFVVDTAVRSNIDDLRALIRTPGSLVRLVGSAGDGKTRMVLEALRDTDLTNTVLYASQAEEVTGDLIHHLMGTADVQCTLVVDEVDDRTAANLENIFEGRPPGVRLVLIGLDATGRPQPDTLQVSGLSNSLLVELIRTIAVGIPDDIANAIAEDCERSPKLAVLVATGIRDEPGLVRSTVLGDRRIQNTLDVYLPIAVGQPDWQALVATALLLRVGWTEEVAHESTLLFGMLDLDATRARRDVDRLHKRYGIAPVAGRFRYVSPAILADHLAVGEIGAWTRERMAEVFRTLTPTMADSFARRARRLTTVLENAAIVEDVILGEQGPFRSLIDVESEGSVIILRRLAAPYPRSALVALERIINGATLEELQRATDSRREMVWALEELLWPSVTFERAARLLLRLASAENETWANNASETWTKTFQTILGGTEAGWESRVRMVREAAKSESEPARILAARAVDAAFQTRSVSRSGTPPRNAYGVPMKEWFPTTYGELSDSLIAYLEILQMLLEDQSEQVRSAAAQTTGRIVGEIFFVTDPVAQRWRLVAESLVGADFQLKWQTLKSIDWALDRWEERRLEIETRASVEFAGGGDGTTAAEDAVTIASRLRLLREVEELLAGRDPSSEFRRAVILPPRSPKRGPSWERENEIRDELKEFAARMIAQPQLMDGEWAWLLNGKEWRGAERWVEVLGEVDERRVFSAALERLASQSTRAMTWLSIYDIAHATKIGNPALVDERAKLYMDGGQNSQAADLLLRAGYTSNRIAMLLLLFEQKAIPPAALNQFAFGSWGSMPAPDAYRLLSAAIGTSNEPSELVPFLSSRLYTPADDASEFRDLAMRILADAAPGAAYIADSYQWSEIAKRYAQTEAVTVAALTLKQVAVRQSSHDGSLNDVIRSAWESGNKQEVFLQAIAPWLDGDYLDGFWVRSALEAIDIEEAGPAFLLAWVGENPSKRAYVFAEVLGRPRAPRTDLQAALLSDFSAEGVGRAFWARFMSGVWVGSHSEWVRSKLKQASQWVDDEREPVSSWAREMIPQLKDDLERSESREAEERFR